MLHFKALHDLGIDIITYFKDVHDVGTYIITYIFHHNSSEVQSIYRALTVRSIRQNPLSNYNCPVFITNLFFRNILHCVINRKSVDAYANLGEGDVNFLLSKSSTYEGTYTIN